MCSSVCLLLLSLMGNYRCILLIEMKYNKRKKQLTNLWCLFVCRAKHYYHYRKYNNLLSDKMVRTAVLFLGYFLSSASYLIHLEIDFCAKYRSHYSSIICIGNISFDAVTIEHEVDNCSSCLPLKCLTGISYIFSIVYQAKYTEHCSNLGDVWPLFFTYFALLHLAAQVTVWDHSYSQSWRKLERLILTFQMLKIFLTNMASFVGNCIVC